MLYHQLKRRILQNTGIFFTSYAKWIFLSYFLSTFGFCSDIPCLIFMYTLLMLYQCSLNNNVYLIGKSNCSLNEVFFISFAAFSGIIVYYRFLKSETFQRAARLVSFRCASITSQKTSL